MTEIIHYAISDIWAFFWFLLFTVIGISLVKELVEFIYNRTLRHRLIMKHGYPPAHCDADGEFLTPEPEPESQNEN